METNSNSNFANPTPQLLFEYRTCFNYHFVNYEADYFQALGTDFLKAVKSQNLLGPDIYKKLYMKRKSKKLTGKYFCKPMVIIAHPNSHNRDWALQ
jgi:hypothetical protein